jgi:hypothetical protein
MTVQPNSMVIDTEFAAWVRATQGHTTHEPRGLDLSEPDLVKTAAVRTVLRLK